MTGSKRIQNLSPASVSMISFRKALHLSLEHRMVSYHDSLCYGFGLLAYSGGEERNFRCKGDFCLARSF